MSTSNNGRTIPAVGYLRRSTDKQEASIPDQTKAIQRYAQERHYEILRWYTDDAVSGDDTDKRHAFLRMIADATASGDFQAILCWDGARFGRFDSIEAGYYIYPLRKAGVYLDTVTEGITDWNDSTGRIVGNVKQEGKHQQLLDLSANVTRGQLEAVMNGSWLGSRPYGYQIQGERKNKRLVLDEPSKVEIVRRIFREFVEERRSMKNIANRLNAEGILSPSGRVKGWRFDSIKVILENLVYTGDYAGCRWSYGKYHRIKGGRVAKSTGRTRNPQSEWIIRRDHHDAIIDRRTYDRAQAILAVGKTGRSPYPVESNPYILSGLLRCGRCGRPLHGISGGLGRRFRYYECSNRKHNGPEACEGSTVREDKLLHLIAEHLEREFLAIDGKEIAWRADRGELTPGDLPKAFAKVRALLAPPKQPATNRKQIEKQVEELARKIEKAQRNLALIDEENIPRVQDEIRGWMAERAGLEGELKKRPPSAADVNAETTEVLRSLYWLGHYFRSAGQECGKSGLDDWSEWVENASDANGGQPVAFLTGAGKSPMLRQYLRRIAGITVHTRIEGRRTRIRHKLERGELSFFPVGPVTGDLNPSRNGTYCVIRFGQ